MKIGIVLGSKSDMSIAEKCVKVLKNFSVEYKVHIASAHRTPEMVADIAGGEFDIFIAIAGLSAALPGVLASHTLKPVIGVPVSGKVNLDSILSVVQMPNGIPVASVGLDRGDNAALLAISILCLSKPELYQELERYRQKMRQKVVEDNGSIRL